MQYLEIVGNQVVTLKRGAGYLQGITVNKNATGTIKIADAVSDVAPYIAGATAFALPTAAGSFIDYDCHFSNGLTITTAADAAQSITVEYY